MLLSSRVGYAVYLASGRSPSSHGVGWQVEAWQVASGLQELLVWAFCMVEDGKVWL